MLQVRSGGLESTDVAQQAVTLSVTVAMNPEESIDDSPEQSAELSADALQQVVLQSGVIEAVLQAVGAAGAVCSQGASPTIFSCMHACCTCNGRAQAVSWAEYADRVLRCHACCSCCLEHHACLDKVAAQVCKTQLGLQMWQPSGHSITLPMTWRINSSTVMWAMLYWQAWQLVKQGQQKMSMLYHQSLPPLCPFR